MTEKEIAEIRRRFRLDKSNISQVRGCYVNEKREIVSDFHQSLSMLMEEEAERILALLKRTLSGTVGKNLTDISFATAQVADSDEHRLLTALRKSALEDEEAVQAFLQRVIQSLELEGSYMILLACDSYDVPYRGGDGEALEDASEEMFTYILCSICPIKLPKPALSFDLRENELHNARPDWLVAPPELGFMFPAFDNRAANIYGALYYTKNTAENHEELAQALFNTSLPMPAAVQKETFQAVMADALAEECSYGLVQSIQRQFNEMLEEHKENKVEEPLAVSKNTVKCMLSSCGVTEEKILEFDGKFDEAFGVGAELSPKNLVDTGKLQVELPKITIQIDPEHSGLVEARKIDGVKYVMIRADEEVAVNGIPIRIEE